MSVVDFAADDLFTFRTVKYLATNPDNKWSNSYEFKATASGDVVALTLLASILVLFEQGLHFTTVRFDHTIISTWVPDSVPYDPEAFVSLPESVAGVVTGDETMLSLDNCFSVRRVPASGRFGHIFYRGCLGEGMVEAPSGKSVFTTPSAMQDAVSDNLTDSELENYLGNPASAPLQMVMISATGTQIRNVMTLRAGGVSKLPTDHAWFNRTPAGPPA
jgi:hypothetical protein